MDKALSNRLPICLQPDHTAYLSDAFRLCIIQADHRNTSWLYSRYIQLYALDLQTLAQPSYIDFADSLNCSDVLDTSTVSREEAQKIASIVQFSKDAVGDGSYIVLFTDDAHLRGQQEPFVHELLIYGHDDLTHEVLCVGLGNSEKGLKRFGPLRFGYDQFESAFHRALEQISPGCPFEPIARPIQIIKPKKTSSGFDALRLATEIRNYLECSPVNVMRERQRYWWWLTPSPDEYPSGLPVSSGRDVYDDLLEHLDEVGHRLQRPDYRQFHVLWEHKVGICKRIEHLRSIEHGFEALADTLVRCQSRATEFQSLRMRVLLSRRGTLDAESVKFGLSVLRRARSDEFDDLMPIADRLACRARLIEPGMS